MTGGYEILTLDPDGYEPLPLGSGGTLQLAALTIPPAPKLPVWAKNGDGDGGVLVRQPRFDVRECSMQIRVRAASMDAALDAIGTLEGKLEEAERVEDGMPVLWQPANSTESLRLRMLLAQITDMPVTVADGWFLGAPLLTVAFTCKPFLYGAEITGPTATGTTPMVTVAIPNVPGDVAAEARLVVTDGSSKPRRFCEWGEEQRYYNAASPAPLFIDSASLVTSGFAGAGTALSGAFGGSAIAATLLPQTVAVCGTGPQPHIGEFRVKGRIWAASTGEYWRLSWQAADGNWTANDWQVPLAGSAFTEMDFGEITIPAVTAGSQSWTGRIEAYTTTVAGETGELDYLEIFPTSSGYGRLEAAYAYQAGVTTGYDTFTTLAAGTVLNGRVAPIGGTWATSGVTGDFVGSGSSWAQRAVNADIDFRYAILGTATPTDVETGVTVSYATDSTDLQESAAIARYTNGNNWLGLVLTTEGNQIDSVAVQKKVSGTVTTLANDQINKAGDFSGIKFGLRLIAYASGRVLAQLTQDGQVTTAFDLLDADIATGGALASGKSGFADEGGHSIATTRRYEQFYVATPATEPMIINSGRSLEVRSDSNLRQSADGTKYGDIPSRGSRLFIPPAGDQSRTSRIVVHAVREDPVTMPSRNDGDTTNVAVFYTPRYLAVPR